MANSVCQSTRFSDNYVLLEVLGRGSFSEVRRAVHKSTGYAFAAKIMNTKEISAKEFQDIEREARICKKLQHPNIVSLHDSIQEENFHYLIFDLITGGELFYEIVTRQFYSEVDASHCIQQILEALHYCHKNGIVHRDVKPENLLLAGRAESAVIKLVDFGLAFEIEDQDQQAFFGVYGTAFFVSPEVLGANRYGTPVDIWACGIILYLLLVGYFPFWDENETRLFEKIKAGRFDFPSPDWDTATPEAKSLISQMLTFDPSKRITASEALKHPWICDRERVASVMHRQDSINCLKNFNARRKLKGAVLTTILATCKPTANMDGDGSSSLILVEESTSSSTTLMDVISTDTDDGNRYAPLRCGEIIHLTEKLVHAINTSDFDTYSELCDPNGTAFDRDALGCLIEGLSFHKFHIENTPIHLKRRMTILNPKVRLLGKDVAVIAYFCVTQSFHAEGRHSSTLTQETRIWHKRNNKWTSVHSHRS